MNSFKAYKHIIWDWNGTLLNDVHIAIECMNRLLQKRHLPLLDTHRYKNIFSFPVKDYYSQLGFDFNVEPFEKLAAEYISEFRSEDNDFRLYNGTELVLEYINQLGIGQSILSASQEGELLDIVTKLKIYQYFHKVAGLNNHYAVSKMERGMDLLTELDVKPKEVLLIGDTIHDYEVANELGCDCLLISNGHQSYERVISCNTDIIQSITEVVDVLNSEAIA